MNTPPPIACRWDGEAFRPLPRLARLADEHYAIGEVYHLVVEKERSPKSHRHYFAMIKEAWENLPEDELRFPTSEHLRKWALIRAGFCDHKQIVCATKAEAVRWTPVLAAADTYAVVVPRGPVVTVYTAKSQSVKAMGAADFQASKDAVLGICAELITVDVAQLGAAAERRVAA
jgi:hypothetical protein